MKRSPPTSRCTGALLKVDLATTGTFDNNPGDSMLRLFPSGECVVLFDDIVGKCDVLCVSLAEVGLIQVILIM